MIILAGFTTFLCVVCIFYGIRLFTHREKHVTKFMLDKYNATEDMSVVQKKKKTLDSKLILMGVVGGLLCGGVMYTVVGVLWISLLLA